MNENVERMNVDQEVSVKAVKGFRILNMAHFLVSVRTTAGFIYQIFCMQYHIIFR